MKFSVFSLSWLLATPSVAEIYVKEQFNDENWTTRWTPSTKWKSASEMGEWKQTTGKWYGGGEDDKGIQTSEDAKFYGISAPLTKQYDSSSDKDLVIQYTVKHEQNIDCGGAYIKLLSGGKTFDSTSFGGDTPYKVMFGPDICGSSNKRTHVILHYPPKKDNVQIKKDIPCETNQLSHLYTLIIKPDNTFEVKVDNKSVKSGPLEDFFPFLEPKEIKDPALSKPEDWVDQKQIPDPEDVKPEGYDDIPAEIPDPDAEKPEDWDDEDDGEWEAPTIDNPDYNGPWSPKMIANPEYKGPWKHPMIPNPDYKPDDKIYTVCADGCTHIGFELWQVKSGTIIDDIIITDSIEEAQKFAEETFFAKKDAESKMFDKIEEENKPDDEDMDMGDMGDMGDMDDYDLDDDDMMHDEF